MNSSQIGSERWNRFLLWIEYITEPYSMFKNKILRNLIECFDSLGLNDIFYTLIVMSCISHIGKCESHQSKIILQSMGLLLSLEGI